MYEEYMKLLKSQCFLIKVNIPRIGDGHVPLMGSHMQTDNVMFQHCSVLTEILNVKEKIRIINVFLYKTQK